MGFKSVIIDLMSKLSVFLTVENQPQGLASPVFVSLREDQVKKLGEIVRVRTLRSHEDGSVFEASSNGYIDGHRAGVGELRQDNALLLSHPRLATVKSGTD